MAQQYNVDSTLQLYDTARGALVPFQPLQPDLVTMYVCGVTVYDLCHIGHGRSYLVWDMVRRYLEFRGYKVLYVQNFTDIDDKIIARAKERGFGETELALHYIDEYFKDMNTLGIRPADIFPRATTHLPAMAEMVRALLQRDLAYVAADDSVYFRVARYGHYGDLSGRKLEDMQAGARVEASEGKEQPLDFAVWKGAKPGEPVWEIKLADGRVLKGRPGWHLECSAMVRQHLGDTIDIHTGGSDLIFPHHENEIAQSRAVTGKPLANYWLHNGFINLAGEKMAKSLGNVKNLRDLLKHYDGDIIRYFVLQKHYRTPMEFSEESLEAARAGLGGLRRSLLDLRQGADGQPSGTAEELEAAMRDAYTTFVRAMDNDFGSGEALGGLSLYVRALHRFRTLPAEQLAEGIRLAERLAGALGLSLAAPEQAEHQGSAAAGPMVEYLLELRLQARKDKNFAQADGIRQRLTDLNVEVNDRPGGESSWSWRDPV